MKTLYVYFSVSGQEIINIFNFLEQKVNKNDIFHVYLYEKYVYVESSYEEELYYSKSIKDLESVKHFLSNKTLKNTANDHLITELNNSNKEEK